MKFSLIIPTYNEKENVLKLVSQIKEQFQKEQIDGEMIFVDDNSPDGTGEVLERLKKDNQNLEVIHREGKLGLSSAVTDGFKIAKGDIVGVMDADLSHPAQKIGEMYHVVKSGADLVIGSRYVKGGRIEGWNLYIKILSKGATLLARVFVNTKDPMSGFFMIKREFVMSKEINPKGFKILLELLIKLNCRKIVEVPITFTNRTVGKSKAGAKEIIYYLQNLIKYLPYKKEVILQFFKFAFVGLIGTIVNVSIMYTLTEYLGVYYVISAFFAFCIAVTVNFIFNKVWTFREKIQDRIIKEYNIFFLVSLSALSVNLLFLYIFTEFLGIYYIISQIIAIGISLMINFIGNKIWTFQK